MISSDYRYIGREALRGKWPVTILVTLLATILGAGSGGFSSGGNSNSRSSYNYVSGGESLFDGGLFSNLFGAFLATVTLFLVILAIARFVVGSAADLGIKLYNMKMVHRVEQAPFSTLFERFSIFGKALGLRFVSSLFIGLWTLLFIIPGIMAIYRYAMAPYLMAQYPDIGIMEALDRSKELMNGHKWELFCLHLSFIGWNLLSVITLGLASLAVTPYENAAEAAWYLDLTGQLAIDRSR